MSKYLLSVHSGAADTGPADPPSPEQMQTMMQGIFDLEADMDAQGVFVFGGRLAGVDAATVVRSDAGTPVLTDGPFVEAKEHIAGFYIIEAADLDEALAWAGRVTATVGAPIEVRPFDATGKAADHMDQMQAG